MLSWLSETDAALRAFFLGASVWQMMAAGLGFFFLLYVGFAALTQFLAHLIFPRLGWGHRLSPKDPRLGQAWREFFQSLGSVAIFGVGLALPWMLVRIGAIRFATEFLALAMGLEMIFLVLWNELYFYVVHRALHLPLLRRFHLPHHRSVVPTPWSTYSFHPVEAMLLGSVLMLPMLLHEFRAISLVFLPFFSLFYNSIGHSNYDFLPWANPERWWLNGSRRHLLHHSHSAGNYGFMLNTFDRVCGTALPDEDP